ncbi:hypothetical protein [Mesorhizobium amorphae]|uniref:hypothetical protein n=1 Tax=Mesorhizobium amorphae TaxID=71433 RepID=UPI001642B4E6|nr:hypothetical protein [Mesorhizobium amorphae]
MLVLAGVCRCLLMAPCRAEGKGLDRRDKVEFLHSSSEDGEKRRFISQLLKFISHLQNN